MLKTLSDQQTNEVTQQQIELLQDAVLWNNKMMCVLVGLIAVFLIVILLYGEIERRKLKADISRLDSMISTKSDVGSSGNE